LSPHPVAAASKAGPPRGRRSGRLRPRPTLWIAAVGGRSNPRSAT